MSIMCPDVKVLMIWWVSFLFIFVATYIMNRLLHKIDGNEMCTKHDAVIKRKHFPQYWLFVRGIHWSIPHTHLPHHHNPHNHNYHHKGQWRRVLMFSLISASTNGWAKHRDVGDLWRHRAHYDVTVMNNQAIWQQNVNWTFRSLWC